MVPYVDAVGGGGGGGGGVAVTVMRVLLFVLHMCLLRVCGGARLTEILVWGWMRRGECRACGW